MNHELLAEARKVSFPFTSSDIRRKAERQHSYGDVEERLVQVYTHLHELEPEQTHPLLINGQLTPTYTYSDIHEHLYTEQVFNEVEPNNRDFMFQMDQIPQEEVINEVAVPKEAEAQWFDALLTPISLNSFDLTHETYALNSEGYCSVNSKQDGSHFPMTSSPLSEGNDYSSALETSEVLENTKPVVIEAKEFPLIDTEQEAEKCRKVCKRSHTQKKKPVVRRTRTRKQVHKFDEGDKPKAVQLREVPEIWNKIQQTKKKGIYKCAHCTDIFTDLYQFANHIDVYKVVRPFKCPFKDCAWSILGLPRRAEVRRHCAAQHSFKIGFAKDNACEETSPVSDVDSIVCEKCLNERVFKRKDSYKRHDKLVHLNPESRFNKRLNKLKKKHNTDDLATLREILKSKSRVQESTTP